MVRNEKMGVGVQPIPHHHKPWKWDSVYHSLSSACRSETLLALKSDFRLADMDSTASNSLPVGVGKVKSRSVEASAVLLGRRACASSTERPKVPMGIHVREGHIGGH